jgi:hypothetical protein
MLIWYGWGIGNNESRNECDRLILVVDDENSI